MDWVALAKESPTFLGLLLLVRVAWRLPAFFVAATELMREGRKLAREGLRSVRAMTAAAQLGHQYLEGALKSQGVEPNSRDPHDSDEMAILRRVASGDVQQAAKVLEQLDRDDSLPLHLGKHLGEALRLLQEKKREPDAPVKRKKKNSGLTSLWRTGT